MDGWMGGWNPSYHPCSHIWQSERWRAVFQTKHREQKMFGATKNGLSKFLAKFFSAESQQTRVDFDGQFEASKFLV